MKKNEVEENSTPVRVLIAEDEALVSSSLKNFLQKNGYEVVAAVPTGEEAIKNVAEYKPDVVLMDIELNGKLDGIEAAKIIYACWNVPVIYLTAHNEEEIIEKVIETNPFGYILKPYNPEELKSTISIALHKHKKESNLLKKTKELEELNKSLREKLKDSSPIVKLKNGFEYDRPTHTLFYKGTPIKLSKKELMLVHILVENRGKNVSFDKIFLFIWGDEKVNIATLRSLLRRVRQSLPEDLIVSIPNVGYRID